MKDNNTEYVIVKGIADNSELDDYRICFEKNGTPRDLKNLQWLHQQNLANTNTIYYAMYRKEVAAIYTALPVIFNITGKKRVALQSIDTITDLEHRGKGLFPKLAAKLYDDAEKGEFELVYGFPNENSAPGFFKKLKWVSFGEAPFMLKPLSFSYFLSKIFKRNKKGIPKADYYGYSIPEIKELKGNNSIRSLSVFGDDYNLIWEKISKNIGVCVDRSAGYMNWRYVNKPGEDYSKCGIFIDGILKGVIVFTIKNKHDGRIGYVMELVYDDSTPKAGKLLLKYASNIFKKERVDAVLAWCFAHSFNHKIYKAAGYFHLPVKLRPQHLFLGVRSFSKDNSGIIEEVKNWYISYSDSDTV